MQTYNYFKFFFKERKEKRKRETETKAPLSGVVSQLWLLATGGYGSPEGNQLRANPLT